MAEGESKIKKRPKLRKVYGAPSINPNEELAMLIEDHNKIEAFLEDMAEKLQKLLDDYLPKFVSKCKAGPPSDYQNLWFLTKEFLDKIEKVLEALR